MAITKKNIIQGLLTTLWVAIGGGVVVLLVAAAEKKDRSQCRGIDIEIVGVENTFFVDKKDVMDSVRLLENGTPVGKPLNSFNLERLETGLVKNIWIKNAELFFDNNAVLHVDINEREPVARVFTNTGTTFYIDTSLAMLPLSDKFSARLPVFTDFPSDRKILSKPDSMLLNQIKTLAVAIENDSFCMAMIEQIDITPDRDFEMVPKMGNQKIVFGDAEDIDKKLTKLKLFYKNVFPETSWNYYSVINLQYKNQVVAKKRDAEDVKADSLRTMQLMQMIAANAEKAAGDSAKLAIIDNEKNDADTSVIQESVARDESDGSGVSEPDTVKPVVVKQKPKQTTPPVKKTVQTPKVKATPKTNNDY